MNERTLLTNEPNELLREVVTDLGTTVEVYPGLFVREQRTSFVLTKRGTEFLRDVCGDYKGDRISCDELLELFDEICKYFDGFYWDVNDKLFSEFNKMLLS